MPAPNNRYDLKEARAHPRPKRNFRLRSLKVDIDPCVRVPDTAAFARPRLVFDRKENHIQTRTQGEDRTTNATDHDLSMSDFNAVGIDAQVVSTTLFQCCCIAAERSVSVA